MRGRQNLGTLQQENDNISSSVAVHTSKEHHTNLYQLVILCNCDGITISVSSH